MSANDFKSRVDDMRPRYPVMDKEITDPAIGFSTGVIACCKHFQVKYVWQLLKRIENHHALFNQLFGQVNQDSLAQTLSRHGITMNLSVDPIDILYLNEINYN